jgi:hypothetical protein
MCRGPRLGPPRTFPRLHGLAAIAILRRPLRLTRQR